MRSPREGEPPALGVWLAAGLVVVFALDHPASDLLVTLAAGAVMAARGTGAGLVLGAGLGFLVFRVVLFGLAGHSGDHVVLVLPAVEMPALLGGLTLGGRVTAEVLLTSAAEGLRMAAVIALFGAWAAGGVPAGLLRRVPGLLFEAGLVAGMAVAFAPTLLRRARELREAQAMRGERRANPLPLLLPLLSTSLEASMTLAETLETRGFGTGAPPPGARARPAAVAAAASVVLSGAGAYWMLRRAPGAALVAAVAGAVLAWALAALARLSPRTVYRRARPSSGPAAAAAVVAAAAAAALAASGAAGPSWDPYSSLMPSPPHGLGVLASMLLAAPALSGAGGAGRRWRLRGRAAGAGG